MEPGEYYFEDYIASLATENDTWLSGRLKVCSLSLVFDPKDYHKPILKIPFTQCGSITKRFVTIVKYINSIIFSNYLVFGITFKEGIYL